MNELNVLKRICRHLWLAVLLCAVSAATASAQVPTVTVDAKNVTIKELLQRIEANSQYTFAYIDADINPDKRVSVKAVNRSIASIVAEVLPNVNMEVKGLKIVLTAKRGGNRRPVPAADAGRTVKGRVTDESGAPVIGATVILKGTTVGHGDQRHRRIRHRHPAGRRRAGLLAHRLQQGRGGALRGPDAGRRYAEKRGDRHGQRGGRGLRRAEQARRDDGHLVHQGRGLRRHADGRLPRRHGRQDAGRAGAHPGRPARRQRLDPHPRHPVGHVGQRPALRHRRRSVRRPGLLEPRKQRHREPRSAQGRLGGGDLRFARLVRRHPHHDQARRRANAPS